MGPLAGIAAGMAACADRAWFLVLPCDCPFVSPAFMRNLINRIATAPPNTKVITPRIQEGFFEPMHTLYSRKLLPTVEKMLAAGERRVFDLFTPSWTVEVSQAAVHDWDPALRSFTNINTPEQLAAAEKELATEKAREKGEVVGNFVNKIGIN
eukprot:TRINITY_DN1061_c1_g2_i3.p1 TRINITY_DN1061_c1_g2~~TRINITY_DN1061_c1_g2_i3.p1  ORF type:complete len:153 (-),score=39.26 TRINITY_DN1061_c1_g2_i3:221-679(-)